MPQAKPPIESLGVECNARIALGRPRITGVGMPIRFIVERFIAGDSVAAIAADVPGATVEHIERAIRLTLTHRKELKALERAAWKR